MHGWVSTPPVHPIIPSTTLFTRGLLYFIANFSFSAHRPLIK